MSQDTPYAPTQMPRMRVYEVPTSGALLNDQIPGNQFEDDAVYLVRHSLRGLEVVRRMNDTEEPT